MTCKDPDLEQVTEVVGVEVKVKVMNKLAIEGGGEGENRGCWQGGSTKLQCWATQVGDHPASLLCSSLQSSSSLQHQGGARGTPLEALKMP